MYYTSLIKTNKSNMKKIISLLLVTLILLFSQVKITTINNNEMNSVGFILHQNNDMILSKQYNIRIILKDQKISIIEKNNESIFNYNYNKSIVKCNNGMCATTLQSIEKRMLNLDPNPLCHMLTNTLARSDKRNERMGSTIRGPCKIWKSTKEYQSYFLST